MHHATTRAIQHEVYAERVAQATRTIQQVQKCRKGCGSQSQIRTTPQRERPDTHKVFKVLREQMLRTPRTWNLKSEKGCFTLILIRARNPQCGHTWTHCFRKLNGFPQKSLKSLKITSNIQQPSNEGSYIRPGHRQILDPGPTWGDSVDQPRSGSRSAPARHPLGSIVRVGLRITPGEWNYHYGSEWVVKINTINGEEAGCIPANSTCIWYDASLTVRKPWIPWVEITMKSSGFSKADWIILLCPFDTSKSIRNKHEDHLKIHHMNIFNVCEYMWIIWSIYEWYEIIINNISKYDCIDVPSSHLGLPFASVGVLGRLRMHSMAQRMTLGLLQVQT